MQISKFSKLVLSVALLTAGAVTAAPPIYYLMTSGGTMKGAIVMDNAGGTNASITESGLDKSSGSTETFDFKNSGAGILQVLQDGLPLWASRYIATGLNYLGLDIAYFDTTTPVVRYIDPINGSDTLCNGKSSASAASAPTCAWANGQRALDDIPNGYGTNVDIMVPAGTFTYAATQAWFLSAVPGAGSAGATAPIVRFKGDCSSPTAVFSTTGTGTFVTTSAGSGKTGGVATASQVTFTPTITSGSITGVTDGSHYLANATTFTAGGLPSYNAVLASTTPNITLVVGSTSALTTRTLCPYVSIFTNVNIVGAPNAPTRTDGGLPLQVNGIVFTNAGVHRNTQFNGMKFTSATTIVDSRTTSSVFTAIPYFQSQTINRINIVTSFFPAGLQLSGFFDNLTGLIRPGSNGICLWVNATNPVSGANVSAPGAVKMGRLDIEGTCTGISASNSWVAVDTAGPGGVTFDVTGQALVFTNKASLRFVNSGVMTGKSTSFSQVTLGANAVLLTNYGVANAAIPSQEWSVPGNELFLTSDITTGSGARSDTVSGAFVMKTGSGSETSPVQLSQGGTGTGTTFTLGSVVFAGISGVYSQDNTNFFWDDTNNRLGILDATPAASLTVGSGDLFQVNSSGRVLADVGASGAGNLSFSFVGDTDTGVYRSAANEMKLQTGGADRLTIGSDGSLTAPFFTSPGGPLYTNGSGVFAQVTAGTTSQVLHGGATPSFAAVALASEVSGTLPTANGGTGGTYPITLTSIPLSGSLSAATLNSLVLPARSFIVTAQRINVSVAGSTGSTNVVLRVTDGTNNCDASFACNATAGAKRPALSGTCTFSASATLTMSVNSVGDCVTPPVILGVLDIEGNWP